MSVEVRGLDPSHPTGERFGATVWWWRPLWDMTRAVAPNLGEFALDGDDDTERGHFADGWGITAEGARRLADTLAEELETGRIDIMIDSFRQMCASLDRVVCEACDGSGIRTDEVGRRHRFEVARLDELTAIVVGRKVGWCNVCRGHGRHDPPIWNYRVDRELVEVWQQFVAESGGFTIR